MPSAIAPETIAEVASVTEYMTRRSVKSVCRQRNDLALAKLEASALSCVAVSIFLIEPVTAAASAWNLRASRMFTRTSSSRSRSATEEPSDLVRDQLRLVLHQLLPVVQRL